MNRTLRVLWLAVGWGGALAIAGLCIQIFVMGTPGNRRQFTWTLISLLLVGILLGGRFLLLSGASVWRWLPDGQRTLNRARAIAAAAGLALLVGIIALATSRGVFAIRYEPVLMWVSLLVVAAVITLGVGRRMNFAGRGLLGRSPTARILESNRLWLMLACAIFATFNIPLIFHNLFRIHARDTYTAVAGGAAGFAAVAMLLIAVVTAYRSRHLWMLNGNSRADVMKTCERALLVVLAVLVVFAWLAPTVLSLIFTPSFNLERTAWLVPALFVATIGPMYLGLAWPTFASWWRNMPMGHMLLLAFLLLPLVWRAAYAIVQPLERMPGPLPILYGAIFAAVLRTFALWRWRRIDWTYLKHAND